MSEITKRIENMHEGQILFISDFSDLISIREGLLGDNGTQRLIQMFMLKRTHFQRRYKS